MRQASTKGDGADVDRLSVLPFVRNRLRSVIKPWEGGDLEPSISFHVHLVRGGGEAGGRDDFENLIVDLVGVKHPGVWGVRANPGDWGIDALVGSLDGEVAIWQSKYFINGVEKVQFDQIQESFKSATKHAAEHGHKITYWTLCIPVELDAPGIKKWDRWKKAREQANPGLTIELMPASKLRRLLITPEASDVLHHYFGSNTPGRTPRRPLTVVELDSGTDYEQALFVRQLRSSGYTAVRGAMKQFFNAEILARDILEKGVYSEAEALVEAQDLAYSVWEERFNAHCASTSGEIFPELLSEVMQGIRTNSTTFKGRLPANQLHHQGMAHQHVDHGDAGWTRSWTALVNEIDASNSHESVAEEASQREEKDVVTS